jgi:hypothetical protein
MMPSWRVMMLSVVCGLPTVGVQQAQIQTQPQKPSLL